MQLLFERSEENPEAPRPGRPARPRAAVRRSPGPEDPAHGLERDPARPGGGGGLRRRRRTARFFYFVHSYYPDPARAEDVALPSQHGAPFCCAVGARQRLRLPVPPGKEPGRRAWRCCAASSRACVELRLPRCWSFPRSICWAAPPCGSNRDGARAPRSTTSAPWEVARAVRRRGRAAHPRRRSRRRLHARRRRDATTTARPSTRIVAAAGVEVEAGGGVRTLDDCAALFDRGRRATSVLGTAAIEGPGAGRGGLRALAASGS